MIYFPEPVSSSRHSTIYLFYSYRYMSHPATQIKRHSYPVALLIIGLIAGCAAPQPQPIAREEALSSQTAIEQAEDSSARGNFVIAAQSYLSLAGQSSGETKQKYLLAAAAILTRGQHIERAKTILAQVDTALLTGDDPIRYRLTQAQIALLEFQPDVALQQLQAPKRSWLTPSRLNSLPTGIT